MRMMERSAVASGGEVVETALLGLLSSFVLGQVIAWSYVRTAAGLGYSKSYAQSLVLLSMIVSLVMMVIDNNLATAFGLLGALAIVRFRNVLKDTRDTVFVFLALVVGMACGIQKYATAAIGTAAIVAVASLLHRTSFGSLGRFDGHLTLRSAGGDGGAGVATVLERFCERTRRTVVRPGEDSTEYVYQVKLHDRESASDLLRTLRLVDGVHAANLVLHDELVEV